MGTRSTEDWSSIRINGVTLGIPAVDETTGEMTWDGGVPNGALDNNLMLQPDGTDANGDPLPPVDLAASGVAELDNWEQPEGAHDAYPEGAIVAHHGNAWNSLTPANTWEPGVSGWRQINDSDSPMPWVQPTGAHDAYQIGDLVTHNSDTWRSTVADNVWEPGVYGWETI